MSRAELAARILSTHHECLRRELPVPSARLARGIEAHGANHSPALIPLSSAFHSLQEEIFGQLSEGCLAPPRHIHLENNIRSPLAIRLEPGR